MTDDMTFRAGDAGSFTLWAEVLGPVIRMHDREADSALVEGLWAADFPAIAAALLEGRDEAGVVEGFSRVLAGMPRPVPAAILDEMAADFADAYLTHGFRAAPTGSVWMTEDHLERQQPMFAVRDWYAHYGLTVPDWRLRSCFWACGCRPDCACARKPASSRAATAR